MRRADAHRTPDPGRQARDLVLASSSRYRRQLLERLQLEFGQDDPAIDESVRPGETPEAYVMRLAVAKARAVAERHPGAVVVGSDQAACCADAILGKPGTFEAACAQLARLSGRRAEFLTAVAVLAGPDAAPRCAMDRTSVRFRELGADEIQAYVQRERPLDCAGSFKAEGLGIALFESVASEDPTALLGLPLIALCRLLRATGLDPLRPRAIP